MNYTYISTVPVSRNIASLANLILLLVSVKYRTRTDVNWRQSSAYALLSPPHIWCSLNSFVTIFKMAAPWWSILFLNQSYLTEIMYYGIFQLINILQCSNNLINFLWTPPRARHLSLNGHFVIVRQLQKNAHINISPLLQSRPFS